jgi:predicted Zn-dependent peptidase
LRELAGERSDSSHTDLVHLWHRVYGKDSPYCYEILGTEESIRSATPAKLRAFHTESYAPNTTQLTLVGDLPRSIHSTLQRYFSAWAPSSVSPIILTDHHILTDGGILHVPAIDLVPSDELDLSPSAALHTCFSAPNLKDPQVCATGILIDILANMLYNQVREKKGLAYNISSDYMSEAHMGLAAIHADVPASDLEVSLASIFGVLDRLRQDKISRITLGNIISKQRFDNACYVGNDSLADDIEEETLIASPGNHVLTGIRNPSEHLELMNSVTSDGLLDLAQKIFPQRDQLSRYATLIRDPLLCE